MDSTQHFIDKYLVVFFFNTTLGKICFISQVYFSELHPFFPSWIDKILAENCSKTWARKKMWPLCLAAIFIGYRETEHPRSELSLQHTALAPVLPAPQDHSDTLILLFSFRHQFPGEDLKAGTSMRGPVKSPHIQQRNLTHRNTVSQHSLFVVWYSVFCKAHLWVQRKVRNWRHTRGPVALQLDRPLLLTPADQDLWICK